MAMCFTLIQYLDEYRATMGALNKFFSICLLENGHDLAVSET